MTVTLSRHHFESQTVNLGSDELTLLEDSGIYNVGDYIMVRRVSAGFYAAAVIFAAVLLLIGFEKPHSTTTALAGLSTVFLVTFVGGALSAPNQERAIAIANERSAELIFLYVSNVHFLDHTAGQLAGDVIEAELEEMGEFIVTMAQERAEKSGIKAGSVVRSGENEPPAGSILVNWQVSPERQL